MTWLTYTESVLRFQAALQQLGEKIAKLEMDFTAEENAELALLEITHEELREEYMDFLLDSEVMANKEHL